MPPAHCFVLLVSSAELTHNEIRIPIPTQDEPKFASFGKESIRAAAKYMDDGALAWTRERKCIACHTTGTYLVDRTMLSKQLGKPNTEVVEEFIRTIPTDIPESIEENGIRFHPHVDRAVWRTAALVQLDKHVHGKLSESTDKALRNLLMQQSSHGGFYSRGEVEIPYVTTDFELTLHAVRALVDAPDLLISLSDPELLTRIERLKEFLRVYKPRNDYERVLSIELASLMPELVSKQTLEASINLLSAKQCQSVPGTCQSVLPIGDANRCQALPIGANRCQAQFSGKAQFSGTNASQTRRAGDSDGSCPRESLERWTRREK